MPVSTIIALFALSIYFNSNTDGIPRHGCATHEECVPFCHSFGYNSSSCSTRLLRMSRICECSDCDIVRCVTFCTKTGLKFVGCSCFALPSPNLPIVDNSVYRPVTNDCSESKYFCQCAK